MSSEDIEAFVKYNGFEKEAENATPQNDEL